MAYSLGSLSFDDLAGDILLPQKNLDIESRTGQDGLVLFDTGKRGQAFDLTSFFVVNSWAAAYTLEATYYAAVSLAQVNIVRGTVDYTGTGFAFVPQSVRVSIKPLVLWQGIRSGSPVVLSPAYKVMATWRLVTVQT